MTFWQVVGSLACLVVGSFVFTLGLAYAFPDMIQMPDFSGFSAWWWRWSSVFRMSPVHECAVYWRSHGCCREDGHRGNHRCKCGDYPRGNDKLFDKEYKPISKGGIGRGEVSPFKSCDCSGADSGGF